MDVKRHVCILCKSKKTANKMIKVRSHWTCLVCAGQTETVSANSGAFRILNLYAGIGGNRKFWTGGHITAVENNVNVAAAYRSLYPNDTVIVGDAHQYLLKNHQHFDIVWSSPPCPTHSIMNFQFKVKAQYPDMRLYQEIIFLRAFFKGKWIVENVKPYYAPLIEPGIKMNRHIFWSNFPITHFEKPSPPGFIELCNYADKQTIQDWLGIYYEKNIYLSGKNFVQVFRNCIHPDIGLSIFNDCLRSFQ